jgi:hypothetical protein
LRPPQDGDTLYLLRTDADDEDYHMKGKKGKEEKGEKLGKQRTPPHSLTLPLRPIAYILTNLG